MRALTAVFGPDNSWLLAQPEFEGDWGAGRGWVESFLADCEARYGRFYAAAGMADACRCALAEALVYHWRHAWNASSRRPAGAGFPGGDWVVRTARAGVRPTTPEEVEHAPLMMGGDPFRDVVVAVGTLRGSPPAFAQFDQDYRDDFRHLSRRYAGVADDGGEWNDLLLHLVTPRRGDPALAPLARFSGYTSLRHWLNPVARNFLTDAARRLRARVAAESRRPGHAPGHTSFERGLADSAAELGFEAVLDRLPAALARIDPAGRELLFCEHRLGESNREIAGRLGVSEGQASRLRRKAHDALAASLLESVNEPTFLPESPAAAEVWQEALRGLPADLLGSLIGQRPA